MSPNSVLGGGVNQPNWKKYSQVKLDHFPNFWGENTENIGSFTTTCVIWRPIIDSFYFTGTVGGVQSLVADQARASVALHKTETQRTYSRYQ